MKKLLYISLGVLLGIGLTVLGYFLYMRYYLPSTINTEEKTFTEQVKENILEYFPTYIDSDVQTFEQQLETDYPDSTTNFNFDSEKTIIWKDGNYFFTVLVDGININLRNPSDVKFSLDSEEGVYTDDEYWSYDEELLNSSNYTFFKLIPLVDETMTNNGYIKSEDNLFDHPWIGSVNVGYENEDTKCVLSFDYGNINFLCSDNLQEAEDVQLPFLEDLDLDYNAIIGTTNSTIEGDYAKLSISGHGTVGGYYIITKKIDGKWTEIYSGQEDPSCSTMEEYDVPESVYSTCY